MGWRQGAASSGRALESLLAVRAIKRGLSIDSPMEDDSIQ
jgi:hypothetical protein